MTYPSQSPSARSDSSNCTTPLAPASKSISPRRFCWRSPFRRWTITGILAVASWPAFSSDAVSVTGSPGLTLGSGTVARVMATFFG